MTPHSQPPSTDSADQAAARDLARWRELLLNRLLRVALAAGAVPMLLSLWLAFQGAGWARPLIGLAAFVAAAAVSWRADLGYRARAWLVLGIAYGLGVWLLLRVGTATQLYLFATPMLAVLLLPLRTALGLLLASCGTLAGLGWGLDLPLPVPGLEHQPGLKWLNHSANYLFLGAMVVLSCSFLLKRLERSLDRQREVSKSLRASQELLNEVTGQVPGMVYRLHASVDGQQVYQYASAGAVALFGLKPDDLLAGRARVIDLAHPEDKAWVQRELLQACAERRGFSVEFRVVLADGQQKWIHVNATAVASDSTSAVHCGIVIDISERKNSEALVWQQAHLDALTGLANRNMLHERLEQALAQAANARRPLALLMIDLDHFKEVNDTLGHENGDLLLMEAGHRIQQTAGDGVLVARLGGDEFGVVLPNVAGPADAERLAQRLNTALSAPFSLGNEMAYVSASIGIALYPDDADALDGLLSHADQALYAAKDGGRNRFRWFTRALQDEAQLRMRLATDLRSALAQGELHLVYQPILDLATGQVRKAEALLRWTHPERGPISPMVFIPIAESSGLILEIGEWVFRSAADQVAVWRRTLHPAFQISVNRSPVQFRSDGGAAPSWPDQLQARGLPGDSIAVEITEGLLLDTGADVQAQLQALTDGGLSISLDDFGTGYSAMAYLQKLDMDYLKIDRSFVSGMQQGDTGRALCKAIIVMAHELGMRVIAEGVETAEQRDWLAAAGCDHGQGYLFGKPMPPAQFEQWMAEHTARHAVRAAEARAAAPSAASPAGTATDTAGHSAAALP